MLGELIVGGPATVKRKFADFLSRTPVDELMISCNIYDHQAQLHSYEIAVGAMESLQAEQAALMSS
jgi:hypothetical protein